MHEIAGGETSQLPECWSRGSEGTYQMKLSRDRSLLAKQYHPEDLVFVLEHQQRAVAWLALCELETCAEDLLGELPATEVKLIDLECTDSVSDEQLAAFVQQTLERIESRSADYVEARVNPELHDGWERRKGALVRAGMTLFQEKEGLHRSVGSVPVPRRLGFQSIAEVGREPFVPVIAAIGQASLDRNDRRFHARTGAENWARVFLSMCEQPDEESWLVASIGGEPVGFIGINSIEVDEPTAWDVHPCGTIMMTGVMPGHRGRGYIGDILAAGIGAARARGLVAMIDTVDVENTPMMSALVGLGWSPSARPWHDWIYRASLPRV